MIVKYNLGNAICCYKIEGDPMNEDVFNLQVRKFLKKVGIQSQREIEIAVREKIESGALSGNEVLTAKVQLVVDDIGIDHEIKDTIALE